ncbi:hypothetical protein EV643_120156 [Kribbella sp. VKM Ac-2527]|uniref:Putative mannosyltransferase YkcA/B-like C-terminal domain-containing protein n=1 Tax=Kribbella caucasensis TaxID=2512215 RepID=A0A4R6JJQ6_9ACTN|nr:hypothetical protein [Kribbella sp. VKM Ac-2527]TDO36424.1 hypothetical protein EV643_120156 [Kribbella sp. VKM Ac-2527]
MFNDSFGTEISWLLPAALIALVGGLWLTRRAPRTDLPRAGLVLWGGWLIVTALVFSYMSGTTHAYYAVALAPAIAGLIGMVVHLGWKHRKEWPARLTLAAMLAATGVWDYVLLDRTPDFLPWLKFIVLGVGVVGALLLLAGGRRLVPAVVLSVVLALGLGTSAYAISTASQTHSGSIPTSGPSSSSMGGGGGGTRPSGGGDGGGGGDRSSSSELTELLSNTTTTWAAATSGSQSAATLELASGKAVIAIGGWSGSDDAPTLAQFQQWVAEGKISYYIASGQGGGGRGGSSEIQTWVEANYTATTVGNSTVYRLIS